MHCLHTLARFAIESKKRCSAPRLLALESHPWRPPSTNLDVVVRAGRMMRGRLSIEAFPGSPSDIQKTDKEDIDGKSETYSTNMTEAMGAVLTYRHELGMNYNFICPDLIVGSCLQTTADVDKLRNIGVKTIFCLQQDPDLEYFGVDIGSIQEYARKYDDIEHIRAQIRDFDGIDLRMRLPAVVSKLYKGIKRNGGVTYVHCTAGLGRAPAVMLAYMFWILGYKLSEGQQILLSKRACFLNLDAIKFATTDILTGTSKICVKLMWEGDESSSVEVSGLDIGWGQRIPLEFDKKQGAWILERELPEGVYEYKYIIDGEWTCNANELVTSPNDGGYVNNYIQAFGKDTLVDGTELWKRLTSEDIELTKEERLMIREFLGSYND